MLKFLFCDVLSSLSMADVPVAVPPDVLQAASPAAIPPPESPAGDENPARPAEEVGCFFSLFLRCSAPSICCVCYADSRLATVVLVNIRCLFCRSRRICLLSCLFSWRVVLACKAAFLPYVAFLMVFCFRLYVLSKYFPWHVSPPSSLFIAYLRLTFIVCVPFKLFSCHMLLSGFFFACVIFKLVSLACVAFRLFSRNVSPSS